MATPLDVSRGTYSYKPNRDHLCDCTQAEPYDIGLAVSEIPRHILTQDILLLLNK